MKKLIACTLAASFLGAGSLLAGGEGWTHDFAAAKATASKDKKDLLMDFTGSDWCGWCIRLNEEVFSKDAFKNVVPNDFVLVELDYPKDETKVTPEIKAQNEKLSEQFAVQGFPTIILADAAGRPYAKTGYQEGGPEKYVAHLATLRETKTARDAAFAKAAAAEGLDKAKFLHEGLTKIDPELQMAFYKDEIEAIIKSDTADTLGYGKKHKVATDAKAFDAKIEELKPKIIEALEAKDYAGADKYIDGLIADNKYDGEMKQRALTLKLQFAGMREDHAAAMKVLDEIIAVDANTDTAKELAQIRPRIQAAIDEAKTKDTPPAGEGKEAEKAGEK